MIDYVELFQTFGSFIGISAFCALIAFKWADKI